MRLLLALLALASCTPARPAPPAEAPNSSAHSRDSTVVGTVRVVGSAPVDVHVVVQDQAGHTTELTGPLVGEVRRLAGAVVAVTGRAEGRRLEVARYEIRSVDGQPVVMGVVEKIQDGYVYLRTPDGKLVYLAGGIQQLRVGQKVWVQGPSTLHVQSFGVIAP
jgi:hypothetical protein